MKKSTAFMKKLTALLVLALALAITLPPAIPPNTSSSGTEEDRNTDNNSNKEITIPGKNSGASLCSDLETPPPPALN